MKSLYREDFEGVGPQVKSQYRENFVGVVKSPYREDFVGVCPQVKSLYRKDFVGVGDRCQLAIAICDLYEDLVSCSL
jgi:hypothetical protein